MEQGPYSLILAALQRYAHMFPDRRRIDRETQGQLDNARERAAYYVTEFPGVGALGPEALNQVALDGIIHERDRQRNSIPLRNADHYLTTMTNGGAGAFMAAPYTLLKMLRGGLDSAPDPIGDMQWSMKPVTSGEIPLGQAWQSFKEHAPGAYENFTEDSGKRVKNR